MRQRCVPFLALALLALAATASADPTADAAFLAEEVGTDAGESCVLVDVPANSVEGLGDAIRAAGFMPTPTPAQLPQCPTHFQCSSIGNCAAGQICSLTDIGACCQVTPMLARCCISGTIKVVRCPCRCTAQLCALQCVQSANVSSSCS